MNIFVFKGNLYGNLYKLIMVLAEYLWDGPPFFN